MAPMQHVQLKDKQEAHANFIPKTKSAQKGLIFQQNKVTQF